MIVGQHHPLPGFLLRLKAPCPYQQCPAGRCPDQEQRPDGFQVVTSSEYPGENTKYTLTGVGEVITLAKYDVPLPSEVVKLGAYELDMREFTIDDRICGWFRSA